MDRFSQELVKGGLDRSIDNLLNGLFLSFDFRCMLCAAKLSESNRDTCNILRTHTK